MALTSNLGFPRIGAKRELKKALESYWNGQSSREDLESTAQAIRKSNWLLQQKAGIDLIPSNDFSFYDHMLDMSCLLGNIPERFSWHAEEVDLDTMFLVARGQSRKGASNGVGMHAGEMTKWFDANYHYIVPEFSRETEFRLASSKPFSEFSEALALGINTKPVLVGPITYLALGKTEDPNFDRFSLLEKLLPVYGQVLSRLSELGAEWVQLDEPVLVLDLKQSVKELFERSYAELSSSAPALKLLVAAYFGELRENIDTLLSLPVHGLHIDCVRGAGEIEGVSSRMAPGQMLSLGVVDGRNIWKNDFNKSLSLLHKAIGTCDAEQIIVAPSCSLIHSPVSLEHEKKLDPELKSWLSFASEKLTEISFLRNLLTGSADSAVLDENQKAVLARQTSPRIHNPAVASRIKAIKDGDCERCSGYERRRVLQRQRMPLPLFPTTTIGSFPQTEEVRNMRARFKKGDISKEQYEAFLEDEIKKTVRFQEDIGIDVLVHGESERNDMVEYFGEQLEGYAFTSNGWVQSYGSRYVKPPIIFGDVSRPKPMTVRWSSYAQSLTKKPMKGMLTGPVTMVQWSFVRNDIARRDVVYQVALALRDEVCDLEQAGLPAIQIDEPAVREGLPLRLSDWPEYLAWAVRAFRLCSSGVRDDTQIHTHMCYAKFNDIISSIADLDADVISIETSRSNMELLEAFVSFRYPNEIGPGVYDIHSPQVPAVDEMAALLRKAAEVLPVRQLWANPDCGLKTRKWDEVVPALKNMIEAVEVLRKEHA